MNMEHCYLFVQKSVDQTGTIKGFTRQGYLYLLEKSKYVYSYNHCTSLCPGMTEKLSMTSSELCIQINSFR